MCALTRYNPDCDLILGHKGRRTAAMQQALNHHGADLNSDGELGEKTWAALKSFQQKASLPVTGRGDAATRSALGLVPALDEPDNDALAVPLQPKTPVNGIRVTGTTVNIRVGPGTDFEVVKTVKKDTVLPSVDADGWYPVLIGGEVYWISGKYTEKVGSIPPPPE